MQHGGTDRKLGICVLRLVGWLDWLICVRVWFVLRLWFGLGLGSRPRAHPIKQACSVLFFSRVCLSQPTLFCFVLSLSWPGACDIPNGMLSLFLKAWFCLL